MRIKMINRKKVSLVLFFTLFVLINLVFFSSINNQINNKTSESISIQNERSKDLHTSSIIGHLNLTNYQVNNSVYYHGDTIPLEGKIYEPVPPPPPYVNLTGYNVSVSLDGSLYSEFSATSDSYGEFRIDFEIPTSINIYTSHRIKVEVTDDLDGNEIDSINHFTIYVKAKSDLQNLNFQDNLYLTGENIDISGALVYDNGTGIPNKTISYNWYNETYQWNREDLNISSDGTFDHSLALPGNATPSYISLLFSYGGSTQVDSTNASLEKIRIFSGIQCNWNITNLNSASNYTEGDNITISGTVFTSHNDSLKIVNRSIRVLYDGNIIATVKTDNSGVFKTNYTIPTGTGDKAIEIRLVSTSDSQASSLNTINITAQPAPPPPPPTPEPIPFLDFFIYLIPILAGIVGALVVYGFFYYRRQRERSKFAKVPLGNKIVNLNILKETNRLEESLSYLFNAIFSELVKAKYGRMRKENETIRDFAILMVKEFQLQPTSIYPFIQKIEEVIYAEPFKVTEEHFYKACDLFAPIYFELTGGQNFVLNIVEFKN